MNLKTMNLSTINPWQWQDNFGYAQAVEIKNNQSTLYCSGQAAMDAAGNPVCGTMTEQVELSLLNLKTVIETAGYSCANIVRLDLYTTSIPDFFTAYGTLITWFQAHSLCPSSTLIQVEALAFPELTIEIEATVVQ